jgi:hypothetical protein
MVKNRGRQAAGAEASEGEAAGAPSASRSEVSKPQMGGGLGRRLYTVGPCLFLSYGLCFLGRDLLWCAVAFFWGWDEHSIVSKDAPLLHAVELEGDADESRVMVSEAREDVRAAMAATNSLSNNKQQQSPVHVHKEPGVLYKVATAEDTRPSMIRV